MNRERLGSPAELARQLAPHLAALADPDAPLPSADELAALVEVTFYASLHEEEARRLTFGVAWQPEARGCGEVVEIAAPVALTPSALAKIAGTAASESTAIAVRARAGELVAWALLQPTPTSPQALTIRVLAPGLLRVDYAGASRALYARGQIFLHGGGHAVVSPSRRLSETFAAWRAAPDPTYGIDLRAAVIARLAVRALAHGHGGMILIVPAEVAEPAGVRVHYGVGDGAGLLVQRYQRVIADVPGPERLPRLVHSRPRGLDGRATVRDEAQIAFAEALDVVARLTAIDNALLLDTDLRVRGFGVQVIEAAAPHVQFRHTDPYDDGDIHVDDLSTFKGTRHPAGVIFCTRQTTEAAAIIASQDGNLSLATRGADGTVEVVGSYQRAFGWK